MKTKTEHILVLVQASVWWLLALCSTVQVQGQTGATPRDRQGKIKGVYPWGKEWPPPRGVGNYAPSLKVDDFDQTSPVGSFKPNKFGLYDMGGNAWEWCEDQIGKWRSDRVDPGNPKERVLRGNSWRYSYTTTLMYLAVS